MYIGDVMLFDGWLEGNLHRAQSGELGPIVRAYVRRTTQQNNLKVLGKVADDLCPQILGAEEFSRAKTMYLVHIRLGDVLAPDGTVERDSNAKRFAGRVVRRPPEAQAEVRVILDSFSGRGSKRLNSTVARHAGIVTSLHKSSVGSVSTALSVEYLRAVQSGTVIRTIFSDEDSNKDWCRLVFCRKLVAGKGGFSKTAADVRKERGRPTVYDSKTSTYYNAHKLGKAQGDSGSRYHNKPHDHSSPRGPDHGPHH